MNSKVMYFSTDVTIVLAIFEEAVSRVINLKRSSIF